MYIRITQEELKNRKERIIHQAFQLFCKYGIDHVTIENIAELSQVGEKSIYRYFGNKSDLVIHTASTLWKEIIEKIIASIDMTGYEHVSGYRQIETLIHGVRCLFLQYSEYILYSYDLKLYLVRHNRKISEDIYDEIIHPLAELYMGALEKGMADGSIFHHDDVRALYTSLWGLIRGYIVKIVIYDRMYDGENMWLKQYDLSASIILRGLRSLP